MTDFEQLSPIIESFDPNFVLLAGTAVLAVGGYLLDRREKHAIKENEANFGIDLGINGPAIDHMAALVDQETQVPVTDRYFEGRKRLTNRRLIGGGLAALALVAALHPTTKVKASTPEMNVGGVIASSYSDTLTDDISVGNHKSNIDRFQSAKEAFVSSSYYGSLSVTEVASSTPSIVYPIGADNRAQLRADIVPLQKSDQNGNCLVSGMQTATKTGTIGELLVVSDGVSISSTCKDNVPSLSQEAGKLKKEGIEVKVIVPGTSGNSASYTYNGSSINPSGVEPQVFTSVFGKKNVVVADSLKKMQADVRDDEDLALPRELPGSDQETDYLPYLLPFGLAVFGFLRDDKRIRKPLVTGLSN